MSTPGGSQPPGRVPTLTEVVVMPEAPTAPAPLVPAVEADVMAPSSTDSAATQHAPPMSDEQLIQRVLVDVQHQVDLMLEYRLREVLTAILARAADGVVRDARAELASTLRDVVARAVAQELSRHRDR
jgi:hypothetical protein